MREQVLKTNFGVLQPRKNEKKMEFVNRKGEYNEPANEWFWYENRKEVIKNNKKQVHGMNEQ